jgi:hypothetical protein
VNAAAAGHSQCLQVGPVGRRRQRRELGGGRVPARQPCGCTPTVRPRRAAPAHQLSAPVGRARRQPRAGSARPTTGNTAAAVSTPGGAAQRPARHRTRSSAAPAPPRTRKAAGQRRDAQPPQELALAERLGERLHLRGEDPPAVSIHIYIGERASPWEVTTHAHAHYHMHVIGTLIQTPPHTERRGYPKADATHAGAPTRPSAQKHAHTRASMHLRHTCIQK